MRGWLRRRRLRRSLLRQEAAVKQLAEIVRSYGEVPARRAEVHQMAPDDIQQPDDETVDEATQPLPRRVR